MSMSKNELEFLRPDWPAPENVSAVVTTRMGGFSHDSYASFNLADHVNDDPAAVCKNRELLQEKLALQRQPAWMQQVHGAEISPAARVTTTALADASWTRSANVPCAVLTADCLPVLFCDRAGTIVAAAHAGWRGLRAGVLQNTVMQFFDLGIAANDIFAWLGPAISRDNYEVDSAVRDEFFLRDPECDFAFTPTRPGHWQFDLYAIARRFLWSVGVTEIYGGDRCTFSDSQFYSHRREQPCGRQAAIIWLTD